MAERIAGKYELLERIGRGGMADVHLAKQVGLEGFEKQVVIKLIRPHLAGETEFIAMFLDEARTAARLKHRNVVDIYEAGATDDGLHFIAMEHLRGMNIAELIVGHREALPVSHALQIAHDAAAGLAYAHAATGPDGAPLNLVHRDVSTVNLFITLDGVVKLLDFGIAKAAHRSTETTAGVVKGNYSYMSPEQAAGEVVDARSDLFSLGIVLWEMLVGQRLFKGENDLKILRQIHAQDIPPPSSKRALPENARAEIDAVVMGLLARDPKARTESATVLLEQLEAVQESAGLMQPVSRLARFVEEVRAAQPPQADSEAKTRNAPLVAVADPGDPSGPQETRKLAEADTVHSVSGSQRNTVDLRPVDDAYEPGVNTMAALRPTRVPRAVAIVLAMTMVGAMAVVFWPRPEPIQLEPADPSGPATKPEASSGDPEEPLDPEPEAEPGVQPRPRPKPQAKDPVVAPPVEGTGRFYVPTNTNPFFDVYVDGRHVGKTPFFRAAAVEVESGKRKVEFRSPEDGSVKATKWITVDPGAVVRVNGPG